MKTQYILNIYAECSAKYLLLGLLIPALLVPLAS